MPNQLNKNKNKLKEKDEIHTAQGNLILAQQAERRRRLQKIAADGHRSAEALLEETRQPVELVEEAREEFLNLCLSREENPDRRESTRTARSAEGARAWSELFVRNTLPEGIDSLNRDPSSLDNIAVGIPSESVRISSVSIGIPSVNVGMAGPKEKLPKFDGDEAADPIRHCKTCETIWRANGIMDTNEWVRQFLAILRGVRIDWFTGTDPQKLNSWDNIKKEFFAEFQLLRDNNEIVAEIFNTKQGKNETVRVFARKLKDLINKMENKPTDGLQKRWFIEGLQPKLRKKMKIVPPSTYTEAYNRAMNLESEQKTKKKKKNSSSDSDKINRASPWQSWCLQSEEGQRLGRKLRRWQRRLGRRWPIGLPPNRLLGKQSRQPC